MQYATNYDIGERKRHRGINEDSVALAVFEQGHRDGFRGQSRVLVSEQAAAEPDAATAGHGDAVGDNGDGATATREEETAEHKTGPANRSVAAFALADGAGGHDAGDAASYLATTVICERLAPAAIRAARGDPGEFDVGIDHPLPAEPTPQDLREAVEVAIVDAHREIVRYAADSGEAAYTTVVAGICVDGALHYGWVGDSRAYVINRQRSEIATLTKDHAVVEELHDQGEIDDVEAHVHPRGNEITRAVGGTGAEDPETATVTVESNSVPLYAEDVVLVTSDGLVDAQTDAPDLYDHYLDADRSEAVGDEIERRVVTDADIRDWVLDADSLSEAAADLVEKANDRGGKDNLSTLLFADDALASTPETGGLPVRAIDPDKPIEDRETVIVREE
jgi:serine/threonine protein phosphatase PrpC